MNAYLIARDIHVGCVILSLGGFAARGLLMLAGSPIMKRRFVRIAPHVVDTLLLASAIWLTVLIHQYPFVQAWLTAKVIGLVVYIGLGAVALRRRSLTAFLLAAASAAYIVSVALTHDPRGFILWL
jgi:uncharacterized membrane protein SirB2